MKTSNNLKLDTIVSSVKHIKFEDNRFTISLDTIKDTITSQMADNGIIIVYLNNKILTGRYQDKSYNFFNNELFEPKHIEKMRIFNQEEEILIWHSGDFLLGRYRNDKTGETVKVVDAGQVLWGTSFYSPVNGFCKLTEERGTEIIIPWEGPLPDKGGRVFIKTRNYISFNTINQATYNDCRFLAFTMDGINKEDYQALCCL
ncbi:MAG: CRISPR-associated protein Csx19 [Ignavibacteria bacterium]